MDPVEVARLRAEAKRLAAVQPGRAIELRLPPYIAVQLGSPGGGPVHRRGTPPAVVEMTGETFLALIDHHLTWPQALTDHLVAASGAHADLGELLAGGPPAPADTDELSARRLSPAEDRGDSRIARSKTAGSPQR